MKFEDKKAFVNGKIFTVNEMQPFAESVVTRGNKILFVGSNADAKYFIDASTEVINLYGKLMLPGFIDSHVHFIAGGFYLLGLDLRPAKSTGEFISILKEYVNSNKEKWITGGNWSHQDWETKSLPSKDMIDDFSGDTPIFIFRMDGHLVLANSLALKLAGITKDTQNPDGGIIEKNPLTGEPTGILKDNAIQLISSIIPFPSQKEYNQSGLAALEEAKRFGVTSVHDITLKNDFITYQNLNKDKKLTCRIYTRLPITDYKSLIDSGVLYDFGNERIKIGSLKAFSDGSLGAGTAWFFENYKDSKTNSGLPMDIVSNGNLEKWAIEADRNQLQLSIHAIGDKANSYVLDLLGIIQKTNPVWDRRFRVEHAQHVRKIDIKRLASLNAIVSAQPYHSFDDGAWADMKINEHQLQEAYSFKSFLEEGIKLCFGSDWTVAPINPLLGIYSAVTRQTAGGKYKNGWIPEEKISVEDSIKCYTINGAFASFEENIKGSIQAGKLADMIVLSEDILSIEPDKIKDVQVDMTIFDGEIIYQK
ncbi:MAG: amidohydrolase [Ignavibacteriaceae bacterium]